MAQTVTQAMLVTNQRLAIARADSLLPRFQLVSSRFHEFEERLDFPAPVIPKHNRRGIDVFYIAQQQPFGLDLSEVGQDARYHQASHHGGAGTSVLLPFFE